jgi:accessory gene regulator B
MVEKISLLLTNKLSDNDQSLEEKEILLFGITKLVEDIPKYLILIVICYFLNILKETALVLLICCTYKIFVGGAHAKTNFECLVYSIFFFIVPVIIAKYISYNYILLILISILTVIFSLYIIIKIAPSDTQEIPIINKNKRIRLKMGGIISLVFLLTLSIFLDNIIYTKIIIYTILLINLFTLDKIYKLLKCKRGKESLEYKDFY